MPKRDAKGERTHLLWKLRRLKRKIEKSPNSDNKVHNELEKGQIAERENEPPSEEDLIEDLLDERCEPLVEGEEILEEDVLNVLGLAPIPQPKEQTLHEQVANRWNDILEKGLKKEEKETMTKENLPFENVPKMLAPKLNKEVSVALNDNARKRDQLIENRQKQMSNALACIGQAVEMCLGDIQQNRLQIIKKINDSGRLLCDSIFLETKGRRTLVLATINRDLKDSLSESDTGEYLFGEDLTDKIRTAKAVQKSAKDLKNQIKEKKNFIKRNETSDRKDNTRALNWWGPPRGGIHQQSQRVRGPTYNRQLTVKKNEDRGVPRRGT